MDSPRGSWGQQRPGGNQSDGSPPRLENFASGDPIEKQDEDSDSEEFNMLRVGYALGYRDGNSDLESVDSGSSTGLREVHSAAELHSKKSSSMSSKQHSRNYSKSKSARATRFSMGKSSSHRKRSKPSLTASKHYIHEFGSAKQSEVFVCSLYITSYNILEDNVNMQINVNPFVDTVKSITKGRMRLQRTPCGLIVAFTNEVDADKVMKLPLQEIFQGPVQVVRFQTGEYQFSTNVVIKDVPWCISDLEIQKSLKLQGIRIGKLRRSMGNFVVEVLNSLHAHKLIEEGLNFFNHASFPAEMENTSNQAPPEIVQCFKCQGFWHTSNRCRQIPRCVRCGNHHDVEYCPRPRNSPICCHCGGPHHAAFKMCPVRLQHLHAAYIGFQLAKSKPSRTASDNCMF